MKELLKVLIIKHINEHWNKKERSLGFIEGLMSAYHLLGNIPQEKWPKIVSAAMEVTVELDEIIGVKFESIDDSQK